MKHLLTVFCVLLFTITAVGQKVVPGEIAKLGEPYVSWYNQDDNELPGNFATQIQTLQRSGYATDDEINSVDYNERMRSAFLAIRKIRQATPNGSLTLPSDSSSLWLAVKDDTINSACGNGNFETGKIDVTEWSAGYGVIISGSNDPMLGTYTSGFVPAATTINAPINAVCAAGLTVPDHATEVHNTLATYGADPTLGTLLMTTASPSNNYSLRIGNSCIDNGSEFVSKKFVVTGSGIIKFMYALVMNGVHSIAQNPSFCVKVFNSSGNLITNKVFLNPLSTTPQETVVSDSTDPFQQHYQSYNYKDWTCATINLDSFVGQTVTVVLITTDCSATGHFG